MLIELHVHIQNKRTMLEVHRDVVASDVGCHRYNRSGVELSNQVARGYAVKIWHNDVHQHQIVLRARVHLVYSFETVKLRIVSAASWS
jgi:hypothetical protein